MYEIFLTNSACKALKSLDYNNRLKKEISGLSNNPFPKQSCLMKDLPNTYRLRIGRFRILYRLDKSKKMIVVYKIGDRKNVYG